MFRQLLNRLAQPIRRPIMHANDVLRRDADTLLRLNPCAPADKLQRVFLLGIECEAAAIFAERARVRPLPTFDDTERYQRAITTNQVRRAAYEADIAARKAAADMKRHNAVAECRAAFHVVT